MRGTVNAISLKSRGVGKGNGDAGMRRFFAEKPDLAVAAEDCFFLLAGFTLGKGIAWLLRNSQNDKKSKEHSRAREAKRSSQPPPYGSGATQIGRLQGKA